MADQVESRRREWLWPERIVMGGNNMLVGMPDHGKSLLVIDIAARVSNGSRWPDCDECAPQGGVVILADEDDPETTIKPRLEAAGAHCSRIALLRGVGSDDPDGAVDRLVRLDTDIKMVEAAVGEVVDCRLVIIDPISAYMGSADDHKNAEVRGVLTKLSEAASRLRVAVLLVSHLRKGADDHAVNRIMGSLAYVAQSRMVWLATWHTFKGSDGKPHRRRIMVIVKGNLTPKRTGLEYEITCRNGDNGEAHGEPHVKWFGKSIELTADEALSAPPKERGRKADKLEAAVEWLRKAISAGPRLAHELFDEADGEDISEATLKRAKKELGIKSFRETTPGPWYWALPGPEETTVDTKEPEPLEPLGEKPANCDADGCQEAQEDQVIEYDPWV